ncbi:macro domain-like protein [Phlebopus sp. FC_14]|nr:macro domain-like protein [Phlebopus sp. FC_14]
MAVKFVLFDLSEDLVDYWKEFFNALVPEQVRDRVTIQHEDLKELNGIFDCIVSPANSFDQELSKVLAPADNPSALTSTAQKVHAHSYHCGYVALCPTMRMPFPVDWHKEIVYNTVWSLLVAIDRHNAFSSSLVISPSQFTSALNKTNKESEVISSVLMTGLATGIGRVPFKTCAKQTVLAFAHCHDAITSSTRWSSLHWNDIERLSLNERLPIDD